MVCKNCGNFVADGHSFCSNCGAKIQIAPAPGSNRKKSGSAAVWIIVAAAAAGLVAGRFIWKTTPSESPSQTAVSSSASQCEQYIDNAKNYMASGDYHGAVGELIDCENATNDDSIISECEDMLVQIISTLKSGEPATGTELERTFQYQGGGEYHVTAESGPVEVTVTDLDNSKQYVRFYVREGETGIIYLPAGRYSVSYNVGYIWFNDRIGFGDYCTNYTIDGELTYEVKSDNAWITNNVWESTL